MNSLLIELHDTEARFKPRQIGFRFPSPTPIRSSCASLFELIKRLRIDFCSALHRCCTMLDCYVLNQIRLRVAQALNSDFKLLGVTLDYKLNFDPHISNLCKKAAAQLNVLKRLKSFIGFAEREVLVQSFVYSNFNYCPLVWYFSSSKSLQKLERIQERALRFLYNDHKSSYDDLLIRSRKCTMQVARQRTLCIEIFKTIKNFNPPFMQSIFSSSTSKHPSRNRNNLNHFRPNQVTFGSKSLKAISPQIWNSLQMN